MSMGRRVSLITAVAYGITALGLCLTVAPLLWILLISLKSQTDAFELPPVFLFTPIADNYIAVWEKQGFRQAFFNSAVITAMGVALATVLGVLTAYALTRLRFRGKRPFMVWLLIAYMLPEFLFAIPMYVLYQKIGLYDTHFGLALVYQVFVLPFTIWLLTNFFEEIPAELEDAAQIDGCTHLQTLFHVYLPITAPGIAATAILAGIWIWNEVTIALALTFSEAQTVTVAMASFRGYASFDWGPMTAASIVAIAPLIVFAAFAQRYIVRGLVLGAVK